MTFLAVGWLALLVPWLLAAAWLWRREASVHPTTASFLWPDAPPPPPPPTKTSLRRRPAAWVLFTLLALLMTILALAMPAVGGRAARVCVVVDPHLSLAAGTDGRTLRDELIDRCERAITAAGVRVELAIRVAGRRDPMPATLGAARKIQFTARSIAADIDATIDAALAEADATIVLTDRTVVRHDDRLVVIAPSSGFENVGIESAVAIEQPRPTLMVRLANFSDLRDATLTIRSDGRTVRRPTTLPARGEHADIFVDRDSLGDRVDLAIEADAARNALGYDDTAILLRDVGAGRPRLTLEGNLPAVAARFAAAYAREGRSDPSAASVLLTDREVAGVALRFATPTDAIAPSRPHVVDHPVLRDVGLESLSIAEVAKSGLPAGEWTTLADVGGVAILAVRERPFRQAWIGFDLDPENVRSVILLSNLIDWLNAASPDEWHVQSPEAVGRDWRAVDVDEAIDAGPGIYLDGSGHPVSVHVPAIAPGMGRDVGNATAVLRRVARAQSRQLAPAFAFFAGILALAATIARVATDRRKWRSSPNLDAPHSNP